MMPTRHPNPTLQLTLEQQEHWQKIIDRIVDIEADNETNVTSICVSEMLLATMGGDLAANEQGFIVWRDLPGQEANMVILAIDNPSEPHIPAHPLIPRMPTCENGKDRLWS